MQLSVQRLPVSSESAFAKFAMSRLEFGVGEDAAAPLSAPPYEFIQDGDFYSICFNMYGIPETDIRVAADSWTQKFTVFAERQKKDFTDQFLWVFSLPSNVDLDSVESFYKKGVVQFNFPKKCLAS